MPFSEKARSARKGDRATTPGFRYDGKTRKGYIELCVPGTGGRKRVRSVVEDLTRDEALTEWKRLRDEAKEGRVRDAEMTLRAYFEANWKTMKLSLSARRVRNVEDVMKARLLPHVADLPMRRINAAVVRDLVGTLRSEGYAPASINGALSILRKFLRDAVDRDVLAAYPIKGRLPWQKEAILRLEMTDEEESRFLSAFDDEGSFNRHVEEEYRRDEVAWLEAMRKRQPGRKAKPPLDPEAVAFHWQRFRALRPLFVVALETGLRKGDLLALRWTSIDLRAGFLRVTTGKTKAEAVVPISPACREALKVLKARAPFSGDVFTTEEGDRVAEATVLRAFALAKGIAGITRRLRFHDLRHSFASACASRGVSISVIAKALGHTSTRMTERYAKPSDEAMGAIVAALSAKATNTRTNTRGLAATGTEGAGGRNSGEEKGKVGTPSGIRTRDLHLERVTS